MRFVYLCCTLCEIDKDRVVIVLYDLVLTAQQSAQCNEDQLPTVNQVVAVKFKRTGKGRSHKLRAGMEVQDWNGVSFVSKTWTTKTPRSGWKMMSKMSGKEVDEWQAWMRCERRAMNWWLRDMAVTLMDRSSAGDGREANTDLPATMYPCSCGKVSCLCRLSAH